MVKKYLLIIVLVQLFSIVLIAQNFTEIDLGISDMSFGSVDAGDFDLDGDMDILFCEKNDKTPVSLLYENNSLESSTKSKVLLPGLYGGHPEIRL